MATQWVAVACEALYRVFRELPLQAGPGEPGRTAFLHSLQSVGHQKTRNRLQPLHSQPHCRRAHLVALQRSTQMRSENGLNIPSTVSLSRLLFSCCYNGR